MSIRFDRRASRCVSFSAQSGAIGVATLIFVSAACTASTTSTSSSGGPSSNAGAVPGTSEPAPTGQRWEGVVAEDGCGRKSIQRVLVDEVCGRTGAGYTHPTFQAPMMRDGVRIGPHLFTVDGTLLWVANVADIAEPKEVARVAGLGQPLAVVALSATELLIASTADGLVRVDVSNPAAPAVIATMPLPGNALDIELSRQGGRTLAYVALGDAGVVEIEVGAGSLLASRRFVVDGYATGLKVRGTYLYAAACSKLVIVDLRTGTVASSAWPNEAMVDGFLVAPAKDVELVGDRAYVAAGKAGTFAIDIQDPRMPRVIGNCSRNDPNYYVSGLRALNSRVFVAAGEYGVDRIDHGAGACTTIKVPASPLPPKGDCSEKPPWEVMPWQETWQPPVLPPAPPPRRDPIQVMIHDNMVYAFGDARRNAIRAVDIRDPLDLSLDGRFEEPIVLRGLYGSTSRMLALGKDGGVFSFDGAFHRRPAQHLKDIQDAEAGTILDDGRFAVIAGSWLSVEGNPRAFWTYGAPDSLVGYGDKLLVARGSVLQRVSLGGIRISEFTLGGALPVTLVAHPGGAIALSPEREGAMWVTERQILPTGFVSVAQSALLDPENWFRRVPVRRATVDIDGTYVEVAAVGDQATLAAYRASFIRKVALPADDYVGIAVEGGIAYLAAHDRNTYRSSLRVVDLGAGTRPAGLVETRNIPGNVVGITRLAGHIVLAMRDGTLLAYDVSTRTPNLVATARAHDLPIEEVTP